MAEKSRELFDSKRFEEQVDALQRGIETIRDTRIAGIATNLKLIKDDILRLNEDVELFRKKTDDFVLRESFKKEVAEIDEKWREVGKIKHHVEHLGEMEDKVKTHEEKLDNTATKDDVALLHENIDFIHQHFAKKEQVEVLKELTSVVERLKNTVNNIEKDLSGVAGKEELKALKTEVDNANQQVDFVRTHLTDKFGGELRDLKVEIRSAMKRSELENEINQLVAPLKDSLRIDVKGDVDLIKRDMNYVLDRVEELQQMRREVEENFVTQADLAKVRESVGVLESAMAEQQTAKSIVTQGGVALLENRMTTLLQENQNILDVVDTHNEKIRSLFGILLETNKNLSQLEGILSSISMRFRHYETTGGLAKVVE